MVVELKDVSAKLQADSWLLGGVAGRSSHDSTVSRPQVHEYPKAAGNVWSHEAGLGKAAGTSVISGNGVIILARHAWKNRNRTTF